MRVEPPTGTGVHNDKLGNPHEIKVFGIRQTNITPNFEAQTLPFEKGGACAHFAVLTKKENGDNILVLIKLK